MCDEQTIKEVEALQAALKRDVKEYWKKRVVNDHSTILAAVNELCAYIVKKQVANQLHVPDNFEGIKEIKTCGYEVEEMKESEQCTSVVKFNGKWHACNKDGERLPIDGLGLQSLRNVESALFKVWDGILEWEAQWD